LQSVSVWCDLIIAGLSKSQLYSIECATCIENMLVEATADEIRTHVLSAPKLHLLLLTLLEYLATHKTELAIEKGFIVLRRVLGFGGEVV